MSVPAISLAAMAGLGVHLLTTAALFDRRHRSARGRASRFTPMTRRLGVTGSPRQLGAMLGVPFLIGTLAGVALFGGLLSGFVLGTFATTLSLGARRRRERRRRTIAHDAWPAMIEEIRLLTSSVGRSIPQALFEVGTSAPAELQPAFRTAQREWLMSTDFGRTIATLERELDDASADAACETLLVAHELGGSDVDRRLMALADDRRDDLRYRKDMRARQAGVRFARRFVLLVPLGMAAAGLSIGDGRESYATLTGQVTVAIALSMVAGCWVWASLLLRSPTEARTIRDEP